MVTDFKNKTQEELEKICNDTDANSSEYKKASDLILRIQLDTNNRQTADLISRVRDESLKQGKVGRWAIRIAIATLVLNFVATSLIFPQLRTGKLANFLAGEPQLDIYLKNENGLPENDNIIFGIKNIGLSTIDNLVVATYAITFDQEECLTHKNGVKRISGFDESMFGKSIRLEPGIYREQAIGILFGQLENFKAYTFNISYREVETGRYFNKSKRVFRYSNLLYTEDTVPGTWEFERLVECIEEVRRGDRFIKGDIVHLSSI